VTTIERIELLRFYLADLPKFSLIEVFQWVAHSFVGYISIPLNNLVHPNE